MADLEIPDQRSTNPEDYDHEHRRGQFKRSWNIGIERQRTREEMVSFDDGLTWGSLGQILGYVLGDAHEAFRNELYDQMLAHYNRTKRGKALR
jgi:hypothetical protein